jgi:hypothetical protein
MDQTHDTNDTAVPQKIFRLDQTSGQKAPGQAPKDDANERLRREILEDHRL